MAKYSSLSPNFSITKEVKWPVHIEEEEEEEIKPLRRGNAISALAMNEPNPPNTELSSSQLETTSAPPCSFIISVGLVVESRFFGKKWNRAVVTRIFDDGTCDVEYDGGFQESKVSPECIRPLSKVKKKSQTQKKAVTSCTRSSAAAPSKGTEEFYTTQIPTTFKKKWSSPSPENIPLRCPAPPATPLVVSPKAVLESRKKTEQTLSKERERTISSQTKHRKNGGRFVAKNSKLRKFKFGKINY